jgi:hypothetical protein
MTDPSTHIASFNLEFLSFSNPLTRAKKWSQQAASCLGMGLLSVETH